MTMKSCRRFTVLDALFLIAATAIGLAWTKYYQDDAEAMRSQQVEFEREQPPYVRGMQAVSSWSEGLCHCVAVVTIALLILRFRGPRARFRRLTCQPGMVASVAVLLAVLVGTIDPLIYRIREHFIETKYSYLYDFTNPFVLRLSSESLAVASAWLLLAYSGRWRDSQDWIDRVGFTLGVFWLVIGPLHWLLWNITLCFLR